MLDHKVCDWALFRDVALLFGIGLVGAFCLQFVAAMSHVKMSAWDIVKQMERNPAEFREAQFKGFRLARKLFDGAGVVVGVAGLVTSIYAMVAAPAIIIFDDRARLALCTETSIPFEASASPAAEVQR